MTDLLHDIDAPSDAELISRVRGGDVAAYGELFARHVEAARRLSRQLVRGPDADDLVSDAFAKVLGVLQGGGGPDVAFRAYLLTAVRRLHVDKIRAGSKLQTSDDMEVFDAGVPFQDTAVAAFESGAAAKAFASLPERWQLVLWHLEVEGQKPADIAPLLGMSANSVSALAYRAREGLRQAFLTMHLNDTSDTSCRWVNEHLGAYVRNGLAKRDAAKVQSHLDECRRCTAMYLELTEVNSNLRGIIAPLLLGAAAAGYLSSTGAAGGGFGLVAFFGRARDAVTANAGAATAGAVAAGVAAVATAGIMLLPSSGPDDTVTGADEPIGQVTTPGEPGGDSSPGGGREDRDDAADDEAGEDDGTAVSEEPALDATPESVPVSDAGTESTADGGTGSETDGGTGGDAPGGDTDPNQPPAEEPPGEQPPGEEPPGEQPPGEQPPGEQPPGEEPPPTEEPPPPPPPGEEPPGEEPTPGPLSVNVTVAGEARIGENSVAFEISAGTEQLPPTVEIDLESDPEGITFGTSAACTPTSPTTVVCSTSSPTNELLSAPFLRALVATEEVSTLLTAPLVIPQEQGPTDLTFTLRVPAGYADPDSANNVARAKYVPAVTPTELSLALPTTVPGESGLVRTVTAHINELPEDYEGRLRFTIESKPALEATLIGPDACEISAEGQAADCAPSRTIDFEVRLKNNDAPTQFTLKLEPVSEIGDTTIDNTATTTFEAFRPAADAWLEPLALDEQGNSGAGTVTATAAVKPVEVPVTLHVDFDATKVQVDLPLTCEPIPTGATCSGGGTHDFPYLLEDRAGNHTVEAVLDFRVAVDYPWQDDNETHNSRSITVNRFGDDDRSGSAGGSSEDSSTAEGLQPSDASSPVVETIEEVAETFTKVARTVTLAEKRPANDRTSSTTSRGTKPAKSVKDAAVRTVAEKQSGGMTSRATGTDRREAVRDERQSRADTNDKKSSSGDKGSQKDSSDTSSTAGTTSDEPATGVVDTVVKGVKKIL